VTGLSAATLNAYAVQGQELSRRLFASFMLGVGLVCTVWPAGALANPSCTNVSSTTTMCQSPGNVQIVTSPGTVATPSLGWPYWGGGLVIGIGGRR
jgi:hypothetical protein